MKDMGKVIGALRGKYLDRAHVPACQLQSVVLGERIALVSS